MDDDNNDTECEKSELFITKRSKKKKEKDPRLRAKLKVSMKKQKYVNFGTQTMSQPFELPLKVKRFFTAAEKKDAIKLLYTSRRAYKLILRERWMHLPSLSSVKRFMQDIKFRLGLNEGLMEVLKLRLESMEEYDREVTIRNWHWN